MEGRPIKLFNHGQMSRDFTYVDDVVEAIVRLIDRPPVSGQWAPTDAPDPSCSAAPWKIYNIGNNRPEQLMDVVALLEKELGRVAAKEMLPMENQKQADLVTPNRFKLIPSRFGFLFGRRLRRAT